MQKIMFDDNFGLTEATLKRRKTRTRRTAQKVLVKDKDGQLCWNGKFKTPRFKVGEVVAVAQPYREIMAYLADSFCQPSQDYMKASAGYNNKMFVRAELMPHKIQITGWHRERIQEISDEDCLMEGIEEYASCSECGADLYSFEGADDTYYSPRDAYAALIKKMSGKRAWDDNPYVDVYEYVLVK